MLELVERILDVLIWRMRGRLLYGETPSEARLVRAFVFWARRHPSPGEPFLGTADGDTFTPYQLAREVRHRTAIGREQVEALRALALRDPDRGIKALIVRLEERARGERPHEPPSIATV
jgi:hypothetical protein